MLLEKRRWQMTEDIKLSPVALQPSLAQKIPHTGNLVSLLKL